MVTDGGPVNRWFTKCSRTDPSHIRKEDKKRTINTRHSVGLFSGSTKNNNAHTQNRTEDFIIDEWY